LNREIFFELVELKAKTASVLPFLLGICFSWYQYGRLHVGYVLIFFIAMFIFNMAVDILDNYNDYSGRVLQENDIINKFYFNHVGEIAVVVDE